jgi:hypothetical protein
MPRAKRTTKKWLKTRRTPAVVEALVVPFREEPDDSSPHQLSLPFPGATVPAIRWSLGTDT